MSQFSHQPQVPSPADLQAAAEAAKCRVFGHMQSVNGGHRQVLAEVIKQFDRPLATILCEPSMTTSSMHPPDIVLVDPEAGVQVIEVKGITLEQLIDIDPGGVFHIRYSTGVTSKNIMAQVRKAMFAILNGYTQQFAELPNIAVNYCVVFPFISKEQWKWSFRPKELLLQDDLPHLGRILREVAAPRRADLAGQAWSDDELSRVCRVFGDNAAISASSQRRAVRPKPNTETLGAYFDERAAEYRNLSPEQQELVEEVWEDGPRLVRGVAGSGKTVVLAANLARRIARTQPSLFDKASTAGATMKFAVVCYNRALPPLIAEKVKDVYRQRTAGTLPSEVKLRISHINTLYYDLSRLDAGAAPWPYISVEHHDDQTRAALYLAHWQRFVKEKPAAAETLRFDTIYVDEGQDLFPDEIELLADLCKKNRAGEPNLIIFYDDAQNLYGRTRPTWSKHNINVVGGRAKIMKQCHRNPRSIIQPAFNVLYGAHADGAARVPGKDFGDVSGLERLGLIKPVGKEWDLHFARPGHRAPTVSIAAGAAAQQAAIWERIKWLLEEQQVRPQDVMVLGYEWSTIKSIAQRVEKEKPGGCKGAHLVMNNKDEHISREGLVTFSTVHSAKGYDAYAVLMIDADTYANDVEHRAAFYVGCTRALEYLEVFASARTGLALEMERAVESYLKRVPDSS
jgi:AAA domain